MSARRREIVRVQNIKPRAAQLGRRRRIHGVNSSIDDFIIRGKRFRSNITDAVVSAELVRTITGASSLTIGLHDDNHELVNHPIMKAKFDANLDGLWFRYLGCDDDGSGGLSMTFESREVAILRERKGHVKALRDTLTRAEFILMMVREVKKPRRIPFFSPELHITQPIRNRRELRKRRVERDDERRPGGVTKADGVTVKGVKANDHQIKMINTILDVAASLGASFRVMSMAIACATQESNMTNVKYGDSAGPDSRGLFQQRMQYWPNAQDPVKSTRDFLTSNISQPGGMIGFDKRNPKMNFSLAINEVQRSAHPTLYQQWKKEAGDTVRAYLGGSGDGGGVTVTQDREVPYAFERKKNESTWAAASRLAEEVKWRLFESAGMIYYVTDEYLLKSRIRMRVNDNSRGIDRISANYNRNKKVQEATITGRAKDWAAPPGTVVVIGGRGLANGRYIVSEIRTSLFSEDFEATLIRPMPALPEPPPETKTITRVKGTSQGGSGGGSGGAQKMVKWAEKNVGVTEGSAKHRKWASFAGNSMGDPWCSIFINYGIVKICGLPRPSGPAYSGTWLEWSSGDRVSGNNLQPGDIIVYDWGDGGITDHVDLYVGGGQCIGGNEGNAVRKNPLDRSGAVGYVRPRYRA